MGEIVKAHRVRVKVCCISSTDEAQLALACGADALGLVGDMPSGPGVISDKLVREIAGSVPQSVDTFLLTSRQTAQDISDHVAYCGTTTVQVVQHIDPAQYPRLRQALPRVKMVQVIHVEDWQAVDLAVSYEPFVDALLLDSGKPAAAIAELGGTGRTHDWQVSAKIVAATTKPVYLAGGLAPVNVGAAINAVRPYGVDLCSGVRTDGLLDRALLQQFMAAVHADSTTLPTDERVPHG